LALPGKVEDMAATALRHVAWESCALERTHDPALESYARRKQGILAPAIPYFAAVPWLARAVIDLRPEYGLLMHVDESLADLIALVVSQENSCRYCYAAVRMLLWAKGVSTVRIERIEQNLSNPTLSRRTSAAIAFGRSQSRCDAGSAHAAREMLRCEGFSDEEMKEIAYVVAETDFSNRAHTFPAIPAASLEEMPDRWHTRLLRPLLKRLLFRNRARGHPTPFEGIPPYPYANVVKAYAGSPIAVALRETLDAMWASPYLTRRCKLLMLAVISRGLGCDACERDVGHALERHGVDRSILARVLMHLDAGELGTDERLLVRFARETIRYEPAAVQKSVRALGRDLSQPQLLEAVGVTAMANGLCRLGAIVAQP
jgi:AhpD family alkylhydroperoxidase